MGGLMDAIFIEVCPPIITKIRYIHPPKVSFFDGVLHPIY